MIQHFLLKKYVELRVFKCELSSRNTILVDTVKSNKPAVKNGKEENETLLDPLSRNRGRSYNRGKSVIKSTRMANCIRVARDGVYISFI